jgi:hypothetical protein
MQGPRRSSQTAHEGGKKSADVLYRVSRSQRRAASWTRRSRCCVTQRVVGPNLTAGWASSAGEAGVGRIDGARSANRSKRSKSHPGRGNPRSSTHAKSQLGRATPCRSTRAESRPSRGDLHPRANGHGIRRTYTSSPDTVYHHFIDSAVMRAYVSRQRCHDGVQLLPAVIPH